MHSWKSCSGKKCFLFIKTIWIKIFEDSQFLNHFIYNASYIESRILNASDLEPIFHNSGNFESEILVRVAFRKKSLTTHQILKCNWFVQKQTLMKVFFQKVTFWIFLAHENAIFCSYAFSQKPLISEKNGRKNSLPFKTFERNQILKQLFNNASDFEARNSKYVRILVKSTQLVIFWIGNFTACQILKHPFLPHVRFWTEILTTQ